MDQGEEVSLHARHCKLCWHTLHASACSTLRASPDANLCQLLTPASQHSVISPASSTYPCIQFLHGRCTQCQLPTHGSRSALDTPRSHMQTPRSRCKAWHTRQFL